MCWFGVAVGASCRSNKVSEHIGIFAYHLATSGDGMTRLIFVQGGNMWKTLCQKECMTFLGLPKKPAHLGDWQNFVAPPLSAVFAVMLSIGPFLHFYAYHDEGFFTEQCAELHHLIHGYLIMGIIGMLL